MTIRSDRLTPSERVLRAQIAAHTRWAGEANRTEATAAMRKAFRDQFERQVDPEGRLDPEVRAKLAANARSAHYKRLALKSAQARRRKKAS